MPRRAPLLPTRLRRPFVRVPVEARPPAAPPPLPIPLVARKSQPDEVVFDLTRRRSPPDEG
jgi:hypothetical protein